jgi:hypothetical protein
LSFHCGLQTKNFKVKQVYVMHTMSWFEGFGKLAYIEKYK